VDATSTLAAAPMSVPSLSSPTSISDTAEKEHPSFFEVMPEPRAETVSDWVPMSGKSGMLSAVSLARTSSEVSFAGLLMDDAGTNRSFDDQV
jgi:hypothetical protein